MYQAFSYEAFSYKALVYEAVSYKARAIYELLGKSDLRGRVH